MPLPLPSVLDQLPFDKFENREIQPRKGKIPPQERTVSTPELPWLGFKAMHDLECNAPTPSFPITGIGIGAGIIDYLRILLNYLGGCKEETRDRFGDGGGQRVY
jgi:hypothetical protein